MALTQVLPIEIVTVRLQFIRKYRARIIYLYFSLRAKYLEKGLTEEISLNGPTFINYIISISYSFTFTAAITVNFTFVYVFIRPTSPVLK